MKQLPANFYEITLNPETFAKLTDKMLSLCGLSIRYDRDASELDTVMLRDALNAWKLAEAKKDIYDLNYVETPLFGELMEQDDRIEYDREKFWDIYRRIADQFVAVFGEVSLYRLPLGGLANGVAFGKDVWVSYFEKAAWDVICFDKRFAKLVMKALSYPDEYLETMNEIDAILRRRYKIDV